MHDCEKDMPFHTIYIFYACKHLWMTWYITWSLSMYIKNAEIYIDYDKIWIGIGGPKKTRKYKEYACQQSNNSWLHHYDDARFSDIEHVKKVMYVNVNGAGSKSSPSKAIKIQIIISLRPIENYVSHKIIIGIFVSCLPVLGLGEFVEICFFFFSIFL